MTSPTPNFKLKIVGEGIGAPPPGRGSLANSTDTGAIQNNVWNGPWPGENTEVIADDIAAFLFVTTTELAATQGVGGETWTSGIKYKNGAEVLYMGKMWRYISSDEAVSAPSNRPGTGTNWQAMLTETLRIGDKRILLPFEEALSVQFPGTVWRNVTAPNYNDRALYAVGSSTPDGINDTWKFPAITGHGPTFYRHSSAPPYGGAASEHNLFTYTTFGLYSNQNIGIVSGAVLSGNEKYIGGELLDLNGLLWTVQQFEWQDNNTASVVLNQGDNTIYGDLTIPGDFPLLEDRNYKISLAGDPNYRGHVSGAVPRAKRIPFKVMELTAYA